MAGCLVLFGATRLVADENNIDKHWVQTPDKKVINYFILLHSTVAFFIQLAY